MLASLGSSVMLLQHNNRRFRFSIPLRCDIAIAIGKLVKRSRCLTRNVRSGLGLPEIEAFTLRNPARGCAHIGNYELNNAGNE